MLLEAFVPALFGALDFSWIKTKTVLYPKEKTKKKTKRLIKSWDDSVSE